MTNWTPLRASASTCLRLTRLRTCSTQLRAPADPPGSSVFMSFAVRVWRLGVRRRDQGGQPYGRPLRDYPSVRSLVNRLLGVAFVDQAENDLQRFLRKVFLHRDVDDALPGGAFLVDN